MRPLAVPLHVAALRSNLTMPQRTVTITNKLGLHARPASQLVQTANRFPCEVFVSKDSIRVNAKSIMGVLMLAASKGTELTIETKGEKATEALDELTGLVTQGFGEE